MKALKTILVAVYVIIIILLLLSLIRCDHKTGPQPQQVPQPDTIVHDPDTVPQKEKIKEKFKADVVMCVDCTGSMGSIIETIKNNALNFYPDVKEKCISKGKEITSMRIKVIGFRDYFTGSPFDNPSIGVWAFNESPFFDMPDKESEFKDFVSHLAAGNGGDASELGYNALVKAINSDWSKGDDVHQVIILWTDDASHPLSAREEGPTTMDELTSLWEKKMSQKGKRLILFAPDHNTWTTLEENWDKTVRHDVNFGSGLSDVDYEEILKTLSETM